MFLGSWLLGPEDASEAIESSLSSSPPSSPPSSASFTCASSSMSPPSSSSSTRIEEWSFPWKASSMYIVHPDSQLLYSSSSEPPWFLGDSMAFEQHKEEKQNKVSVSGKAGAYRKAHIIEEQG